MTLETISNEDPGQRPVAGPSAPTEPQLRSGARATALTTAVSLVLVGGVVTAAVRGTGHSSTAETLAPASAFAFAQVDLSLADGQSSALSSLLGRFPDSPTHKGKGSLRDRVLRAMLRDSSDPHVDYDKDVKPWLGDHAAVAAWLDSSGKPQVEFMLQSKNDGAARASLHRANAKLGVAFSHGYAVMAATQALSDAAVAAARKSSLSNTGHFHSDVSRLTGPQLISGWVDVAAAAQAVRKAGGAANPLGTLPPSLFGGARTLDQVKGRAVFGVRATKTYAEIVAQSIDSSSSAAGPVSSDMLKQLPDATIGGAEIASPGKIVRAGWGIVSGLFGMRESAMASGTVTLGGSGSSNGSSVTINPTVPAIVGRPAPRPLSPIDQIEKATGLRMPGDAETLLGSAMVVAYGGLQGQGLPKVAVVTRPANLATARALAEHSRDVIARNAPVQLSVGARGSDLVLASTDDYRRAVETGGRLGTQPGFTEAMGDVPDRVTFAAYANLAVIVPLLSHGQRDLDRLAGLGIWASSDKFQLRVVVH